MANQSTAMDNPFLKLELEMLKALHEKETEELKSKLLNGSLWHEVSDQKNRIIQISIAIHKKTSARQKKTSGSVSQNNSDAHPQ